jgi:hypothetical protein
MVEGCGGGGDAEAINPLHGDGDDMEVMVVLQRYTVR